MPITNEGRLLIENLIIKLEKEIETNEELIPVLEEIIGEAPPEPEPYWTTWKILAEPYLNVRLLPSLNAKDIGNVYPGVLINVYEELIKDNGDLWGEINNGWIALRLGVNIFAEKVE